MVSVVLLIKLIDNTDVAQHKVGMVEKSFASTKRSNKVTVLSSLPKVGQSGKSNRNTETQIV
jgi:hypothetical protein